MIEHRHGSLHWAFEYMGKPYVEGKDGPDEYDCWGLVREVCAKKINCNMPLVHIGRNDNEEAIRQAIQGWKKVDPPYKELDVLTMKNKFGRHIGVCIKANGRILFLHAEDPRVQITELQRLSMFGYQDVQGWRYEQ